MRNMSIAFYLAIIVAILLAVGGYHLCHWVPIGVANVNVVQSNIKLTERWVEWYEFHHGEYPESLDSLWESDPMLYGLGDVLGVDLFGNKIQYSPTSGHGMSKPDIWFEIDDGTRRISNWTERIEATGAR